MFANLLNHIIEWFGDRSERGKIVRSFNTSARDSFVSGVAPTLLKSSISKGDSTYKHQFSDWLNSGFRIQAFTGKVLSKNEIVQIGQVILNNNSLVRKLVTLGFDTLEIHGDAGKYGCKWQLKDYLQISGQ
jgi:hypothetical protein